MANKVLTSLYKMIQDSANDDSIASAVQTTVVTPTLYDNFDDLRNNPVLALMDTDYNGSKVTPTNTDMFRGYPRPTTTMNWEEPENGVYPNARYEELYVDAPEINNKVGFIFLLTLAVTEKRSDTMATLSTHNETLQWVAGDPDVSSSPSGMPYTGGKGYRVTDNAATASYNVVVSIVITANWGYYGDTSHNATLTYTAAATKYSHLLEGISALSCAGTAVSPSEFTAYSYDSVIANGSVLYTSTAMTTTVANDNYFIDKEDASNFYYGATSSGVVSSFGECFE